MIKYMIPILCHMKYNIYMPVPSYNVTAIKYGTPLVRASITPAFSKYFRNSSRFESAGYKMQCSLESPYCTLHKLIKYSNCYAGYNLSS